MTKARQGGPHVVLHARRRGPLFYFKPTDEIERKNSKARRAAVPFIAVSVALLIAEALLDGEETTTTLVVMLGLMVLFWGLWWFSARVRLTDEHLEIRNWGRTRRIPREGIVVLVYDTRVQQARYHSIEDRLVIFMGEGHRALGYLSQNQWGKAFLSQLEGELGKRLLSFDHEESPPELGNRYPGLFPWYIQRPILGGLFLTPVVLVAVIGIVALAVFIDEHI